MRAAALLRVPASTSIRLMRYGGNGRRECATRAATKQPGSMGELGNRGGDTKKIGDPKSAILPSPAQDTTKPTSEAFSNATKSSHGIGEKVSTEKIPDIPSSSLGLWEEQDAKDPNKWKKFAWKYAGSVVVFLVAYKALHWYVDRVEAEGKRQREELEEKKKISEELHASQRTLPIFASPPLGVPQSDAIPKPSALVPSPLLTQPANNQIASDNPDLQPQTPQVPKDLLDQFAAPLPQTSSELDELYAYRKELQEKLIELSRGEPSAQTRVTELEDLREELASLAEEICFLETKDTK